MKVKNISTAKVVLALPDMHFRQELMPGREIPITTELYESMLFDPGINIMVHDHFIEFLGVNEEQPKIEDSSEKVYPSKIKQMFENQDITNFAKFIPNAAPAEKDAIVKLAVDMGVTNSGFVTLIKKYCDVDIVSAINTKHLIEE